MPQFRCPSCGAEAHAGDEFAGKRIVCPECRQSCAVPTNADATPEGITTPEHARGPRRCAEDDELPETARSIRDANARTAWLAWLTMKKVLIAISVCVIGPLALVLFLPGVQRVRETTALDVSRFHLREIGHGLHGFHDFHKRMPFNGSDAAVRDAKYSASARAGDFQSGSWAFQILPFIDQNPLFNDPRRDMVVAAYLCPGRGRPAKEEPGGAWCDYFLNPYLNDPKQAAKPDAPDQRRKMTEITDGTSMTIFVGHGTLDTRQYASTKNVTLSTNILQGGTSGTIRAGDNGEHNPEGNILKRDSATVPTPGSWGGPFPRGALMCMGDATVRMFPYTTQDFGAFLTPTGNEGVELPDN